jgi:hypothetical protein
MIINLIEYVRLEDSLWLDIKCGSSLYPMPLTLL